MTAAAEWSTQAIDTLRDRGYRTGGARTAVIELLGQEGCCLTAKEIADRLATAERPVGMASIYRALDLLDQLKLVTRLDTGEGTARYERALASGEHHHHMVCNGCGKVEAFEDHALEEAIDAIAERVAFGVTEHEIVLRGRCERCR